jgi:hypothetical protein
MSIREHCPEIETAGGASIVHRVSLAVRVTLVCLATLPSCLGAVAASAELLFGLPVQCRPGDNCVIQKYVDTDTTSGYQDYRCGSLSSDTHDGTDFRITSLPDYYTGIAVIAMADGVVRAVRDDMQDVSVSSTGREAVKAYECGNGAAIVHVEGYETQYCHLRKGSLQVRQGEKVRQGQTIGVIGMSGLSEYPHVHVTVRKDGKVIDPFTGAFMGEGGCNVTPHPLWEPAVGVQVPYVRTGILEAFFCSQEPKAEMVWMGRYEHPTTMDRQVPVLTFVATLFGPRNGDQLSLKILYQGRQLIAERVETIQGNKAQVFSYIGRKRPSGGWPSGEYVGLLRLAQTDGTVLERRVGQRIE